MHTWSAFVVFVAMSVLLTAQSSPSFRKLLIAHRGASGSAPEHTMAAYRLALSQHADFVEPDLAITRDGVMICLHDDGLERTTNVEELFPDRFSRQYRGRDGARTWLANDFTIAEIKTLDAGSWHDARFAGERVPTWDEMVALVRGHGGLYPELKSPPLYTARGVDMVQLFVDSVKTHGLDQPESLRRTPLIIQSFDETSVRRVAVALPSVPRVFLTTDADDMGEARLRSLAAFASGIAPEKGLVASHPDMVARAHALGLTVTAWTFRADERTDYASVRQEMAHFLYSLGIDAVFTNNPDQFPPVP